MTGEGRQIDELEQMRTLLHSLPVLVTTRTRDGTYTGVYTDQQVLDYQSSRAFIGKQTEDVLNPPAAEAVMDGVRAALDTGEYQRIEFPLTIGGERFFREGRLAPYNPADDGDPEEAIMVSFDVSERHARERALHDALEVLGTYTSRAALEGGFCDRLVARERYEMAWIGTANGTDEPTVRATANAGAYLDTLRERRDNLRSTNDPGVRGLRTRAVETESQIEPSEDGDWTDIATAHDAHAAVAVPLERNDVSHGVLAVYMSDPEYLVPWRRELLALYGDAVAYGLSAVMRQWTLATDSTATVEMTIPEGMALLDLCYRAAADVAVRVESVVPRADGTRYYLDTPANASEALADAARATDGVVVDDETTGYDDLTVVVDAKTPESQLANLGVNFERFHVSGTEVTLTATIPDTEGVRPVIDLVREAYPGTRFSVEWGDDALDRAPSLGANVAALLTDRQHEALEIAYRSGYFEKERGTNLSEMAERLSVSRWTYAEHLRVAQRKLLAQLLD